MFVALRNVKMWSFKILQLLCTALCCVSAAGSIDVIGYEGRKVEVPCRYDPGYEDYEKYLCRNDCADSDVVITTSERIKSKYFIYDDKKTRIVTVTISNPRSEDAGRYWCGVSRTGKDIYTEVKLEIKAAALCCERSGADLIRLIGYQSRKVEFRCRYDRGYEDYEKYLCRNDCGDSDVLITTSQRHTGKYSMYDDKKRRIVTVTISDLRSWDARWYKCVVRRKHIKDIYTSVNLEIKPDVCCDKVTKIQSQEEASVSISCPYESQDQNKLKYICRGKQPSTCLQQAVITSDSTQNTRFTLSHDKTSTFTVTISSLTLEDSGSYLCGVHRDTGLDVFSAVHLEVKGWCCVESKNMSGIVGRPVTLQCPYPPQHQNNSKFLCKGDKHNTCTDMMSQSRFTLHNVSSSSFWVTITELEAGDAGTYWCGSDSQWGAHNYTNIHLAADNQQVPTSTVDFPVETSTLTPNITTEPDIPDQHVKDENPFIVLVYVLPAVLIPLLILVFVLVMVLKNKCNRFQESGDYVNVSSIAQARNELRLRRMCEHPEDRSCRDETAGTEEHLYQSIGETEDIYSFIQF